MLAALIKHVRQFVPESHPTLICTNGNLNLANKALLDALVQRGAHLFYGGDFDQKGWRSRRRCWRAIPAPPAPGA